MLNNLSIKIIIGFCALAVIWFTANKILPGNTQRDSANIQGGLLDDNSTVSTALVSAIQPIKSDVQAAELVETDDRLISRFNDANQLAQQGNTQAAINAYKSLIEDYPYSLEPYLNLAAVYVQQKQLDQARLTLNAGLNAKPSAAALYQALQKVHSALAGQAYQRALNKADAEGPALTLQLANRLSVQENPAAIAKYEQQLSAQQSQHQIEINAYQSKVTSFESQLASLQGKLNSMSLAASSERAQEGRRLELAQTQLAEKQAELLALQEEQTIISQQLLKEQTSKAQLMKDLQAQQQAREQVENQQLALLEQQKALKRQEELNRQEQLKQQLQQQEIAKQQAERDAQLLAQQSEILRQESTNLEQESTNLELTQQEELRRTAKATRLVQQWAKAWSAQDVDSYVSFYTDTYAPTGKNLTHEQWLAQRQVRLTNKPFINVDVSNFSVNDLEGRFSVTFVQHYRSNNIDDRIRKRLTFVKNGDDWSKAKIINERVL